MAYDGSIMQRALARYDQDKQRRADELEQRRRMAFTRQPRLAEIERELRGTMGRIVTSALQKGTDPLPAIRVLRDENLELQRERAELLTAMGEPIDYLDDKPACPLCGDTGYRKGQVCDCLKKYYAREQLHELSRLLPLGEATFDSFRFDYYDDAVWPDYGTSPRANMERNFDVCRDYAQQFSKGSGNLLLSGGTGLGKTFLSACIARVVSDGGYSVVYDTAGRIFSRFEEAKFRGDAEVQGLAIQVGKLRLYLFESGCKFRGGSRIEYSVGFIRRPALQPPGSREIAVRFGHNVAPVDFGPANADRGSPPLVGKANRHLDAKADLRMKERADVAVLGKKIDQLAVFP